jgi:hypothetical protein
MSEKLLFLFGCQPGRGVHIKKFITCRNPFETEGGIGGLYGTPEAKILFECINAKIKLIPYNNKMNNIIKNSMSHFNIFYENRCSRKK